MLNSSKKYILAFIAIFCIAAHNNSFAAVTSDSESLHCLRAIHHFEKKYNIPSNFLYLIALVESGQWDKNFKMLQPYPWTLNLAGKSMVFKNKREMLIALKANIANGRTNIDIGCGQINYQHHKKHFSNLEQMVNPYYNVEYSARYLSRNFKETKDWGRAIALYHSRNPTHSSAYIKKIKSKVKNGPNLQLALNTEVNNRLGIIASKAPSGGGVVLKKHSRDGIMVYNANNR
ncbi:transglycosylase SLT domain-containing protein [Candidatus Bandiella euplotis]|uniref:Polysaccharide hydrolase n=1 Tax=Candidatus Bandiella euplotis TaxID=1664265 RepID=A0ABZ0UMW6_9RICK|nr:transglycosylase SLT domain-containing protein [Candidatus Bandiella woodruffii]WPX97057.1 Putative polysaccharide hydrolase [Candidatus Bandiella woodruffii]